MNALDESGFGIVDDNDGSLTVMNSPRIGEIEFL